MKKLFLWLLLVVIQLNYAAVSPQAYARWITNFIQAERALDLQAAQENQLLLEGAYHYLDGDEKSLAQVEKYVQSKKIVRELPSLAVFIQNLSTRVPAIAHEINRKLTGMASNASKERQRLEQNKYYEKKYTGVTYTTTLQEIAKNMSSFLSVVGKDNNKAASLFELIERDYDAALDFYRFIDYELRVENDEEVIKQFNQYSIILKPGESPSQWLENQFKELRKIAESINDAGKKLSKAQS